MTPDYHILLIEDDNWLREGLSSFLQQAGFTVLAAADLCSARRLLKQSVAGQIDIVVCDVGLPDGSGLNLVEELRHFDAGKILISASSSEQARIVGLKTGADDYICKPVNPDELLLRIQALLRRLRPPAEPSSNLAFLDYQLNLESRQLQQGRHSCYLSTNEHQLLLMLIAHQGKIVPRNALAHTLELTTHPAEGRALDILVSRLRNKMQFTANTPSAVVTYRGKGYMLLDRV